jgi:hyperosmotically inducible protein
MRKSIIALFIGLLSCGAIYAQESRPLNEQTGLVSREDSVITADVRNQTTRDERLRGLIFDLVTKDGVVTVTGTIASQAQADRIVELAKKTPGVVSVVNRLKINVEEGEAVGTPTLQERGEIVEKGEKELDEAADISGDARILNEIKTKLAADDLVKSRNIRTEATEGVVLLRGTVRTREEEQQAISLVNSVPGVKEVRSELVIDPSAR